MISVLVLFSTLGAVIIQCHHRTVGGLTYHLTVTNMNTGGAIINTTTTINFNYLSTS